MERKHIDATGPRKGEVDAMERLVARSGNGNGGNAARFGGLAGPIARTCDSHTPLSKRTGIPREKVDAMASRLLSLDLPRSLG